MSNIVDFLENVGQNASLRYASRAEMQRMLANSLLDQDAADAVLAQDQHKISALLQTENIYCKCLLMSGMNDDDEGLEERRA
jgi:hypothetical protein